MANDCLIQVCGVNRIFPVPGGEFQALKDINVEIMRNTLTILKGSQGIPVSYTHLTLPTKA